MGFARDGSWSAQPAHSVTSTRGRTPHDTRVVIAQVPTDSLLGKGTSCPRLHSFLSPFDTGIRPPREVHRALASWSRATDLSRILFQKIVPTQHPKGVLGLLFPMCRRDDRPPCCSDRLLHEPSKWNRFMITAVATKK